MKIAARQFLHDRRSTLKLAASYLIVIMVMSISFSLILYFTSIHGLEKRPPGSLISTSQYDSDHEIDEWLGRRAADNRNELTVQLTILNIVTFFVGACLSYYLARKTLQPIESVMRDQERFIADASHELRTPLTSILLSNEVALRKKDLTVNDARNLIEQNVNDINELKNLSDELLDVSIDSKQPHIQPNVDVQSLVKDGIQQVKTLADAKHIKIMQESTKIKIATDKALLQKVVVILLDNAIKYSAEHEKIRIAFTRDDKRIGIRVSDNGIGIASSDMDNIFERFFRTDTSRSQIGGHGLGLSIAAKLTAKLRGEITVNSTLGRGSQFTLWIFI